jgi:hypothetical protein
MKGDTIALGIYGATTLACGAGCIAYSSDMKKAINQIATQDAPQVEKALTALQAALTKSVADPTLLNQPACQALLTPMQAYVTTMQGLNKQILTQSNVANKTVAATGSSSATTASGASSFGDALTGAVQSAPTQTANSANGAQNQQIVELLDANLQALTPQVSALVTQCGQVQTACQSAITNAAATSETIGKAKAQAEKDARNASQETTVNGAAVAQANANLQKAQAADSTAPTADSPQAVLDAYKALDNLQAKTAQAKADTVTAASETSLADPASLSGTIGDVCNGASALANNLVTDTPALEAQMKIVKEAGIACQGVLLGAGVADVALASQVQDNGKSMMTAVAGLGVGEAINFKGISAAVQEIKGNQSDQQKLTVTLGKSACWSTVFSAAEMGYHMFDLAKTGSSTKQNQELFNATQSGGSSSAWHWTHRLWAKLSNLTLSTAIADTPPSLDALVRACPSGVSTPDALLGCAAERDPVIKNAVNNPQNPIGQIFSVLNTQMGVSSSTFLSTTPPSFDQIAGMLSRGDSGKQAYLADAFSSMSINGETVASLGPITFSTERNLASVEGQQAPSLLAQVPAAASAAVSSNVDEFSGSDARNLFQRISDRYQVVTPRVVH